MGRFFWVFLTVVGYLVAFDIAGVLACLITEVLSIDFALLSYTIWGVAGVFCGLLAYDASSRRLAQVKEGDWSGKPESGKWGLVTVSMTVLLLGVVVGLLYKLEWSHGAGQSNYVPDSVPLTFTFFATVLGSMIAGHVFLRPK